MNIAYPLSFPIWGPRQAAPARPVLELHPAGRAVRLQRDQHLRLTRAQGMTVEVLAGTVWITQETDVRDTFVNAGERFLLDRGGETLVAALDCASLRLHPAAFGRSAIAPTVEA